jgi:hypothetical protein
MGVDLGRKKGPDDGQNGWIGTPASVGAAARVVKLAVYLI